VGRSLVKLIEMDIESTVIPENANPVQNRLRVLKKIGVRIQATHAPAKGNDEVRFGRFNYHARINSVPTTEK
jgi:hypothetical protein